MVRRTHAIIALATIGLTAGFLQAQPTTKSSSLSHAELTKMVREAHTPQQYKALADYYRSRETAYEQQAQSEKAEWERRSQNITGPTAKYPRPVDSSRNRYEYFAYEAQQMSQQAAHYDGLSTSAAQ